MNSGESLQAEPSASDAADAISRKGDDSDVVIDTESQDDAEAQEDDAWIEACRQELDETDETDPSGSSVQAAASSDPVPGDSPEDNVEILENKAVEAVSAADEAAIDKTGDDAMSKFGHAIGALAKNDDDLDAFPPEPAPKQAARDEAVAPHIAAAERELERSRSAAPLDIFDRIAQAAESQFDESRGSTAKRVSELVDDRRVGTKRWTPSKTMKKRMEKLEAARAAAEGGSAEPAPTPEAPAAVAASAPRSSTAQMVSPDAKKQPEPKAKAAVMAEDEKVTISRRDRQPEMEETLDAAQVEGTDGTEEEELDADGLRVVPGARGRRRDRARKSRLDEDFEKIFDDEGKPSINSLRRKLRSASATPEGEAGGEEAAVSAIAPAAAAETDIEEPKKGLFARLLKSKKPASAAVAVSAPAEDDAIDAEMAAEPKKGLLSGLGGKRKKAVDESAEVDEDALIAAFEAGDTPLDDALDMESGADEDWQVTAETKRKQKQVIVPIIAGGGAILFGGVIYTALKFFGIL